MTKRTGVQRIGPATATLAVRTGRTGAAAKAGHDLLIHVTKWEATLDLAAEPAATTMELSADATSLRVREGHGGMQALGDGDMDNIRQTIDADVLKRKTIVFRSTRVQPGDAGALAVEGELTIVGTTRPIAFELVVGDDGTLAATAVVTQTTFGMKPYSALFGALKVADDVTVVLDGHVTP